MAININTLFADIIDTPEQRQQKLLQQGMAQGQLLASGLTGRARALAPLAQMAGQLGVQRNEDLRRAVQPMLGIDPRTTGEKLQETLRGIDTSSPDGLLQAAQAVQAIDPVRAATLRQAAAELRRDLSDRELNREAQQVQIDSSRQSMAESAVNEQRRAAEFPFVMAERVQAVADGAASSAERAEKFTRWKSVNDLELESLKESTTENTRSLNAASDLRTSKAAFEKDLAATYDETKPEEAMIRKAIEGGLFGMDTLETLATTPPTDYRFDTASYFENGRYVNYNVAVNKSDPTSVIKMERASDQPDAASNIIAKPLTETNRQAFERFVTDNPSLSDLTNRENNWFSADREADISVEGLVSILNNLTAQGLNIQQAKTLIDNSPIEDIRSGSISAAAIAQVENDVLSDPAYAEFVVGEDDSAEAPAVTEPAVAESPREQQLSNPFDVRLRTEAPSVLPEFRTPRAGTGVGRDSAFEARLKDAKDKIASGMYSPERLQVVRNDFMKPLRATIENASQEIRYLTTAKGVPADSRKRRIDAQKAIIAEAQKKIKLYPSR